MKKIIKTPKELKPKNMYELSQEEVLVLHKINAELAKIDWKSGDTAISIPPGVSERVRREVEKSGWKVGSAAIYPANQTIFPFTYEETTGFVFGMFWMGLAEVIVFIGYKLIHH